MTMDRDTVIDKVQKLFRLANGTTNEGEMNNALFMARRLLEKYDLSMSDVEVQQDVEDLVTVTGGEFTRAYAWVWSIAHATEFLCNTKCFRSGSGWSFRMNFCGTKTDCAASTITFQFLFATLQAMGRDAKFPGIKERNSYLNGVGFRVYERTRELLQPKKDEAPTPETSRTTAIVLVKNRAAEEYMKNTWKTQNTKPTTVTKDRLAYAMGYNDGNRVPLSTSKALKEGV